MTDMKIVVMASILALAGVECVTTSPGKGDRMEGMSIGLEALKQKRARYADVEITVDETRISPEDREVLVHLVRTARIMGRLFWMQASADGLAIREGVAARNGEHWRALLDYIDLNAGVHDRLDHMEPFHGTNPRPLGATFYPADMTREEFEAWIEAHPEDREAFQSWFTVIRRDGNRLVAVPYSVEYRRELEVAANHLKQAADLTSDPVLARYLRGRAGAFLSNDYFQSDMDWMDLGTGEPPSAIEVVLGPYEVYEDALLNLKAAFEAFVTIRDHGESRKLALFGSLLDELEGNLPIDDRHKNFARGSSSPIEVVDVVYTAGDTAAGVQTTAFNLPNDERVRTAKGSKKVMLRNVTEAKFRNILLPIAGRILQPELLADVTFDAFFNHILLHEISHGLGPGVLTLPDGTKTTVNLVLRETYSAIEEAKADTLGIYNAIYLAGKGVLEPGSERRTRASVLAGFFRSVRFGITEAHGRSNIIQFNYLREAGAVTHDPATGRFGLKPDLFDKAVRSLAGALLRIQAEGDLAAARALLARYGEMPPEVRGALDRLDGVPVDIRPHYTLGSRLLGTD
jgi:hypothetical protein